MLDDPISQIAKDLRLRPGQVSATASLLDGGGTVPFIARYRKENTGSLDEVEITSIRNRLFQIRELTERRRVILESLEKRGLLTNEFRKTILGAETLATLEDIYLPYRPKRRTRATIAKEKRLEPLALKIWGQEDFDVNEAAAKYVDSNTGTINGVDNVQDALTGARDIIAEWVSENTIARREIRKLFWSEGTFSSSVISGKREEASKYRDYFDWKEPVIKIPSHRVLAMLRGEKESMLSINISPPAVQAVAMLQDIFITGETQASDEINQAIKDRYKPLLEASMETEVRKEARIRAEDTAIAVFADNLRELLMAPAIGQKNVLALDPGFRSGCKVACLDSQGQLLHNDTVYPHTGDRAEEEAGYKIVDLCRLYDVEAIAVGNGTASRETEGFLKTLELDSNIDIVMVNENGASVYSASEVARNEFPDHDLTVRGTVSIGRRLMDPLSELVKIDPKSIGVGQYQHDVDQKSLKERLDEVVGSCVNNVGVELNTASAELLSYVSGLGPKLANAIVKYRKENGPFSNRESLKNVPRLGPKVFEQAAGFLRIRDGDNPLDSSAVHPESYEVVRAIAKDLGKTLDQMVGNSSITHQIDPNLYLTDKFGLPTLTDIIEELARPGRDPREEYKSFSFAEDIQKIEDLSVGMKLPGIITNVTAFGAFVDVGVHHDGLVHISNLANKYVSNPADEVKVQQHVWVTVLEVDMERKRIGLSMKE